METNKLTFELAKIPEPKNSHMTNLPNYQEIKKAYFQNAKAFASGELTKRKFFYNIILPTLPATSKMTAQHFYRWTTHMEVHLQRLLGMYQAAEAGQEAKTLLQKEHEKLVQQVEIRQDVTEVMHSFIQRLKAFVGDEAKMATLTQKEMLDLYKVIREEEDRAKALTLKERAEDRADAQFAWFISQARAGMIEAADIEFLTDDIKEDLSVFKNDDGTYSLPTGTIPKIKSATKARVTQPD